MKKIVFLLLLANIQFVFSQDNIRVSNNCNTELVVEKSRNTKSADEDGAIFPLVLTNNSSKQIVYTLSFNQLKERCDNGTLKSERENSILDISFLSSNNKNKLSKNITLNSGQSLKFNALVNAPKNTPYYTWGCIEVQANSNNCKNSTSTILKVYVPDPSEE